jgi:hypothetical protein
MHDRSLDLRWRNLRDGGEDCIMTRWAANVTRIEEMRDSYNILVGKPEEKGTFGRIRRR